jgi:WD40 repeat protein
MGIVSMALSSDTTGNPILICGTVMGKMMIRSLMESMTMKTPPMCLLCTIDARYTFCGHEGVVNSIKSGPGNTFYSGGEDGKIFVWQITGGFGL